MTKTKPEQLLMNTNECQISSKTKPKTQDCDECGSTDTVCSYCYKCDQERLLLEREIGEEEGIAQGAKQAYATVEKMMLANKGYSEIIRAIREAQKQRGTK